MTTMKLSEAMELGFLMTKPARYGYIYGAGSKLNKSACAMQAALVGVGKEAYNTPIIDAARYWNIGSLGSAPVACPTCSYHASQAFMIAHVHDVHGGREAALSYTKELEASMTPPEESAEQEDAVPVEEDSEMFSPEREEELVPA